jgi:WD40 repeat protein
VQLKAHEGYMTALALHPNKQTLISGGMDGSLYVWNYDSLQQDMVLREAEGGTLKISSLAFNPDGTILACGITRSLGEGWVELRETQSWHVLGVTECAQVNDLAWSPDGSILAVASDKIHLISGTTYQETNRLSELDSGNHCVIFSRSGELLIAGGDYYDPNLAVWDVKTLKFISKIPNDDTEIVDDEYFFEPFSFLCATDDVVLLRDMNGIFEYNIKQNSLKLLNLGIGSSWSVVGATAVSTNMQYIAYAPTAILEAILDRNMRITNDQNLGKVYRVPGVIVWIKELQTGKIIHKVEMVRDRVTVLQFVENNRLLIGDNEGFLTVEDFDSSDRT